MLYDVAGGICISACHLHAICILSAYYLQLLHVICMVLHVVYMYRCMCRCHMCCYCRTSFPTDSSVQLVMGDTAVLLMSSFNMA